MFSSKELALDIVKWAEDKKAIDPVVIDIGLSSTIADYFVIFHANNPIQAVALAEHISDEAEKAYSLHVPHKEGINEGSWVLLDMGSVVVHIFDEETRSFYDLERLWDESPRLSL
ncbi:MAG: ribosome silencing factor [Firmicutes bacterium]|jgi:ribosome-associated protein|nr:ribosome silencing factor [Bacillota bacterium]